MMRIQTLSACPPFLCFLWECKFGLLFPPGMQTLPTMHRCTGNGITGPWCPCNNIKGTCFHVMSCTILALCANVINITRILSFNISASTVATCCIYDFVQWCCGSWMYQLGITVYEGMLARVWSLWMIGITVC